MRPLILLAGPALLLAACGGTDQADNTINADESLSAESFSSNDITAIDAVTGEASNMAADVNYIVELDNLADGNADSDDTPAAAKSSTARRSTSNAAATNSAEPEPQSNATATATANNAL